MIKDLPFVSIVIPAYNCASTIEQAIIACQAQTYLNEKLEIIVVDDGSTDNTAKIIRKFPVQYIYQKNCGPAKARNTGWKSAGGDIICFTDSDCQPEAGWVINLISKFSDGKIAAVAGSYKIANSSNFLAGCIYEEIIARHLRMPEFIRAFGSYNVAVRKVVLEELKGFNQAYRFASGEDNDLSYKILRAGYKICFAKDAYVYHYFPEVITRYLTDQSRHGFWRVKLYQEHFLMSQGDDYTNWKDILEPPLALILILAAPLMFFPALRAIFLVLLIFYAFLQIPMVLNICFRKKRLEYLFFTLVTFARGFARGWGCF